MSLLDPGRFVVLDQGSQDGSWGVRYDEWFKKPDPMIQAMNGMSGEDIAERGRPAPVRAQPGTLPPSTLSVCATT